jgi:hypothetical protein
LTADAAVDDDSFETKKKVKGKPKVKSASISASGVKLKEDARVC